MNMISKYTLLCSFDGPREALSSIKCRKLFPNKLKQLDL